MSSNERVPLLHHPDRWLVVLRVVVGLWFLKSAVTKLGGFLFLGFIPLPAASDRWLGFLPQRLLEYSESVRMGWYSDFLAGFVVPNAGVFAHLTAFGETVIGLGLTLGLATRLSSVVGLVVMANYFLATFWVGYCQQGFHILLITCMTAFLGAGAGRTWGLDGEVMRRFPDSFPVRWRLI